MNEIVRAGKTADTLALLLRGLRVAPAEVFQDRAGEQHVFLQHDRDLVTQRRQVIFTHIVPADANTALRYIVQAGDQVDEARLRAARTAEDADGLPGLDVQVDVLQDGLALALPVGEADVVKIHAAVRNGRERLRRAGEVGLFVQHLADAAGACHAHAHHDKDHGDHHQAHEDAHDIAEQAHQAALREAFKHDGLCAEPRQAQHAAEHRQHHHGVVERHVGLRLYEHAVDGVGRFVELAALIILAHEGLDDADSTDVLLHAGVQIVVLLKHAVERARRLEDDERQRSRQNHDGRNEDHAQAGVNGKCHDERRDEHDRRAHADARDHLIGELHVADVCRQARNKACRGEAVDVRERKALDVGKHGLPQIRREAR